MRTTRLGQWNLVVLVLVLAGCDADRSVIDEDAIATRQEKVVYGEDDRQDVYAHPDGALQTLARESIVALVQRGSVDERNPNDIQILGDTLEDARFLCSGERFASQGTGASCSGTLIDDDLVLTAGHCVTSEANCQNLRFVFNYHMEGDGQPATITQDDVYQCQRLAVQRLDDQDYAIVQLDRPVTGGHVPATVKLGDEPVVEGEGVTCIGFPSGIPAKIDAGGVVTDPRAGIRDFFRATTDTFGGNSGSGVFNIDREVVGILVRGAQDYVFEGGCFRVNELPAQGRQPFGEEINYASRAIEALCEANWPSQRLCPQSGEGDWCDTCAQDVECLDGWSCLGHPQNPNFQYCASPCGVDGDCREDHACQQGRCIPRTEQSCVDGDAWTVSSCGEQLAIFQPCTDAQVCLDGACEDVIEPDEADLEITASDIVFSPENPIEDAPISVRVTVHNRGQQPLPRDILVELYNERDGVRVRLAESVVIRRDMAPGESVEVEFEFSLPVAGPYTIVAVGDPGEPDDPRNNEAERVIEVLDDDTEGPVISNLQIEEFEGDGDGFIEVGEQILVTWVAEDPSGVNESRVYVDGVGAVVTLERRAVIGPLGPGEHLIEVDAVDGDNSPAVGERLSRTINVASDRPEVIRLEPFTGATGVPLDSPVSAVFDIPLDPASVIEGVLIVNNERGETIAGTTSYDPEQLRVTFTPAEPLEADMSYGALIFGVTDPEGDGLAGPVLWDFSTEGLPTPAVALIRSPEDGALVGTSVQITGTATDPNFGGYVLVFAPEDNPDDQQPIGEPVFQQVIGGLLGTWDTSDLNDGAYILTLAVVDVFQNFNIDQHRVIIDNTPPTIEDLRAQPGNLTEGHVGSYVITATITDSGTGLVDDEVVVSIGIEGQPRQRIVMTAIGEDQWRAETTLPWAQLGGQVLIWEISAQDGAGQVSTAPVQRDFIDAFDDPPVILPMPVVEVGENDETRRAFDLFEFVRDNETPVELLDIRIREVGAQGVEARIEDGRFISVEARDNFTGTTTVTITVSDGQGAASGAFRVEVSPDDEAPSPNPPTFLVAPEVGGPLTARMVSEEATDRSGVQYFFEEVSGSPGGDDSGWQDSLDYVDEGLVPGTTYSYTVRARDLSSRRNETRASEVFSVTMPGQCDVCEPGTRRCLQGGFQICEADVLGCSDFGPVQGCGEGRVCDDGLCVSSCQDECPEAGLGACLDSGARRFCGDFDDDPCLEYGESSSCGLNEVCQGEGVCVSVCERDEFEPNDDSDVALFLDPGEYPELWACQDDDWYAIDMRPGELLVLTLEPTTTSVSLALYEGEGELLVEEVDRTGEEVRLTYEAEETMTVSWRVGSVVEPGNYDLNVSLQRPRTEPCTIDSVQCTGRASYQLCVPDDNGLPVWSPDQSCDSGQVCGGETGCRERNPGDVVEPPVIDDRFGGDRFRSATDPCACAIAAPADSHGPLAWLLAGLFLFARRRR